MIPPEDTKLPEVAGYQWLMTAPNPRSPVMGHDAGRRGWRWHAVPAAKDQPPATAKRVSAACGLRPRHGWDFDLYADDTPCARCLAKVTK